MEGKREHEREEGRSMVCGLLSKGAKAKFSMVFVCLPVPWGEKRPSLTGSCYP